MRRRDAGEKARRIPVTFRGEFRVRLHQLSALLETAVDQLANLIELHPRIDRADFGVLVERIANAQGRDAIAQLEDHGGKHAFLDEQPRARATNMTLVEINP